MLDTSTKRRIDTARDILVGKVPDPKSQVEQITIALIYKFMDDMDAQAEEFGGKRTFFAGAFERFGWVKLMRSGLGGHEMLALYAEAITTMPQNPGIPLLFRSIFNNAYLPYRDPETLRAFLKIIDEFDYDHSEKLGDAFEYLLSVLGSQGDAGQFRTPRHIIDFMVAIIDPKKDEKVLDPACGTAGFLISAYKHILASNKDADGDSTISPDEMEKLEDNFIGYDISPDMVRLSLVNLYLHGFADPNVYEYDTLTSDDRWNEFADVILANPPFMSPKGGIKPHNRFSIQAKRSEVLFVDYMAEHLTPTGRAGIIVPEGIIFQSQTAYKELRKLLVDNSLVAVVSLPAGCFNPYSGVKTSILILDRALAKQSDTIAFFKVENDGFGLGAQRRAINKNDLPQVASELAAYLQTIRNNQPTADPTFNHGLIVPKASITADRDYNLSGGRYVDSRSSTAAWPMVDVRSVSFRVTKGTTPTTNGHAYQANGINFLKVESIAEDGKLIPENFAHISADCHAEQFRSQLEPDDVLFSIAGALGRVTLVPASILPANTNLALSIIRPNKELIFPPYLAHALGTSQILDQVERQKTGVAQYNLSLQQVGDLTFPLPSLASQRSIVAEIEGYQKVIDGARAVLDNYRPHIPIHPDWPMVPLGEIAELKLGKMLDQAKPKRGTLLPYARNVSVRWGSIDTHDLPEMFFAESELERFALRSGDVLVCEGGEPGRAAVWDGSLPDLKYQKALHRVRFKVPFEPSMLVFLLQELALTGALVGWLSGTTIKHLTLESFSKLPIPLPPLATQQAIIAEIEAEQALVTGNSELIRRFEKKIQASLARVWGEDSLINANSESANV